MPTESYRLGDYFKVQFVWKIPSGDFLRALFEVEVQHVDRASDKYVVKLNEFLAGRQESPDGEMRELEETTAEYWNLVSRLPGKRISLAFEADDGRPLWLRLETLTGEHNFFSRLNQLPEQLEKLLDTRDDGRRLPIRKFAAKDSSLEGDPDRSDS